LLVLGKAGFAEAERPQQAAPSQASASGSKPPHPNPKDAETLLAKLATLPGLEGQFREEKKLALLKLPLVSEGRLYYMPPGYLLRKVNKPSPSSVLVTPTKLVLTDRAGKQQIDLRSKPAIKLFVESFTRVLAGDHAALKRSYRVQFTPAREPSQPWELRLIPKGRPLSELIRSVMLQGRGYAVERVTVLEANGDVSETQLQGVNPRRRFSPSERRELFGLEPPAE
jgi:hypothetical protein